MLEQHWHKVNQLKKNGGIVGGVIHIGARPINRPIINTSTSNILKDEALTVLNRK